ncbi:MAG: penicillin acylase family protein [Chloroflexota bacterium]|nr:penicillin acylase family protein [Chloroflexota bacterium]
MKLLARMFGFALGRRLPVASGELTVSGVDEPVSIGRDRYGIPYIQARSDPDAWFGVGFCQGQDRAFQLELMQRVFRGTLSELIGSAGLPLDRVARRLGLADSARRQAEQIDPEIKANLEAFARGVNAGVQRGLRRRPHEFLLLRSRPTPYTLVDVIGAAKLHALALASNWDIELARFQVLCADGPAALADLDPTYRPEHPVAVPPGAPQGQIVDRLSQDLGALREIVGGFGGSNAWALAATKTAAGSPILANDPHLRPMLPPHWYLARVGTPDWSAAGATYVGGPAFPAGHNGHCAWGVTATLADTTDLFIEQLSPDGRSVREGEGFVACSERRETIRVRRAADVVERVLETPRGPIVAHGPGGEALSLRAIWLDPLPVRGMLDIHRARTFDQFRHACADWPLSTLSMVFAGRDGRIGWQMMGSVPIRRRRFGTVPLPGWPAGGGWDGEPVPHSELPSARDPESGVIATANNSPAREGGPWLGADFVDGYRARRILDALGERDGWGVKDTMRLQLDVESESWKEMRSAVLAVSPQDRDAAAAQALLASWDGRMDAQSPAASVFALFCGAMGTAIVKARAPKAWDWALGRSNAGIAPFTLLIARRDGHTARLLKEQPGGWFDEGWEAVIGVALTDSLRTLRRRGGRNPESWSWGRIRPLTLHHPIGSVPLLGAIFNRGPHRVGGDGNTILQALSPPDDPLAEPLVSPSLRVVVDTGEWENSRFCLPGGQSGNPASPHYDDQLRLWLQGDGVPIAWRPEAIEEAVVRELWLRPAEIESRSADG